MSNEVRINIVEFTGTPLCTATAHAKRVFEKLKTHLENDDNIVLSFAGYTMLIRSYLDLVIGQLYLHFDQTKVEDKLQVIDLSAADQKLLSLVQKKMRHSRQKPDNYNDIWHTLNNNNL